MSRGPLSISIQVQGMKEKNSTARRAGARVGDRVYVSGALGDGAIALLALGLDSHLGSDFSFEVSAPSTDCRQYFSDAYFKPQPQIVLGSAAGRLFSSCIDISDGLRGDLQHILDASGVACSINADAIPYSEPAACCVSPENRLRAALFGGDDYELCFTVAEKDCAELEGIAQEVGVRVTCIGEIDAGEGMRFLREDGSSIELSAEAFLHFRSHDSDAQ